MHHHFALDINMEALIIVSAMGTRSEDQMLSQLSAL